MSVEQLLADVTVLPVIVIDRIDDAVPLARALIAGGIRVLEVTLRTPAGLDAIATIGTEVPEVVVGAGTVTTPAELEQVTRAGARFAVSPGLTPVLRDAGGQGFAPLLPGVMTPAEVMQARDAGFTTLKLFPAAQAGGIGMLKALAGPFADVRFCPTGGVSADNAREFLALPNVVCVGGSWLAPKALIDDKDWSAISQLALATQGLRQR